MAQVKIENVIESLDYGIKRALADAVKKTIPGAQFDKGRLFREFVRAVGYKCQTWGTFPTRMSKCKSI